MPLARKTELDLADRMTPDQTAGLLNVSRSAIWRWMLSGDLPFFHVGGRRYLSPAAIEAFLRRRNGQPINPKAHLLSGEDRPPPARSPTPREASDAEREIAEAKIK